MARKSRKNITDRQIEILNIAFNHAPNARQFRSALSEKTYMRKAELPRQIFLLFCCKYCCSVHSSKDNGLHSFT